VYGVFDGTGHYVSFSYLTKAIRPARIPPASTDAVSADALRALRRLLGAFGRLPKGIQGLAEEMLLHYGAG
jgi:hypothetical protein